VPITNNMISANEFKRWANTLNDDDDVAIDDGGLTLVARGPHNDTFAFGVPYLEVGGIPLNEEEESET
jgi:hypothetical protein